MAVCVCVVMTFKAPKFAVLSQPQTAWLLALAVALGITFRLVNLEQKVFWVDEVLTALRIAGYTRAEVTQALSDGRPRLPADLLAYQQIRPSRGLPEAMQAFQQSPEHAPFYFLLLRLWAELFGSSVLVLRSFSVVCGLLLLGAIYRLSGALFNPLASQICLSLTALSPLFIAYAQEARPYSLWLLILSLNSLSLLRALRHNQPSQWRIYALTLTLSLYSSLLTVLVVLGQIFYVTNIHVPHVCATNATSEHFKPHACYRRFGLSLFAAGVAFLPWLWLVGRQWQTLQANTAWMRLPLDGLSKLIVWFYSVAILYFDVPVRTEPRWIAAAELGCAALVVALVGRAFLKNRGASARFVGCLALAVPLGLISLDLLSDGRYSTAPRYLLPFHLGAQLAVAGWLSQLRSRPQQSIIAFLVTLCLLSNLIHLNRSPHYLKSRSLYNPEIAAIINQQQQPLVISESQDTIDMLALSHLLRPETQIKIWPTAALSAQLTAHGLACGTFFFNPSQPIQAAAQLTQRYRPPILHPGEFALTLWWLKC